MPRGKTFLCYLGRYNEIALYLGDEVDFQPWDSKDWIKGKVGCKRTGAYIVRVGRKEYPLYTTMQVRKE